MQAPGGQGERIGAEVVMGSIIEAHQRFCPRDSTDLKGKQPLRLPLTFTQKNHGG